MDGLLSSIKKGGNVHNQLSFITQLENELLLGDETSLRKFPVARAVKILIRVIQMDSDAAIKANIISKACRALTNLMLALPRSSGEVMSAIPVLLEKLSNIQYMDTAEQSLKTLEMLSRNHSKSILKAGGIPACLRFFDFFSVEVQCHALAIIANCCGNPLTEEDFQSFKSSLNMLRSKLLVQDRKCVESSCWAFAQMVDNLKEHPLILREIASDSMIANIQTVLRRSPGEISNVTFSMVIRMLVLMCHHNHDIAVALVKKDICGTLVNILGRETDQHEVKTVKLVPKSSQELFQIVSLIEELIPQVPPNGFLETDHSMKIKTSISSIESVLYEWKGHNDLWNHYPLVWERKRHGPWNKYPARGNQLIEAACCSGEQFLTLSDNDMIHAIDFTNMREYCYNPQRTATYRIRRTMVTQVHEASTDDEGDAREEAFDTDPETYMALMETLFGVICAVYNESVNWSVKHRCLQTLLNMAGHCTPDQLQQVLGDHPISSHIATMLASQDLKVIVGALQMAEILIHKLPDVFKTYFQHQGVTHQIRYLATSKGQSTSGKQDLYKMYASTEWYDDMLSVMAKASSWVKSHASRFLETYYDGITVDINLKGVIPRLLSIGMDFSIQSDPVTAMRTLTEILRHEDISPTDIIYSGLPSKFYHFLLQPALEDISNTNGQNNRFRQFASIFLNCPGAATELVKQENVHGNFCLSQLIEYVMACLHQQENFHMKTHDIVGGGPQTSPLKYGIHPIKCTLASKTLNFWSNGTIQLNPMVTFTELEIFLEVFRRYCSKDSGLLSMEDDIDYEDLVNMFKDRMLSYQPLQHKFQFLIGDHCLPYNMTIYQAIKNYGNLTRTDGPLQSTNIWTQTHTIWYRPVNGTKMSAVMSVSRPPINSSNSYLHNGNKTGNVSEQKCNRTKELQANGVTMGLQQRVKVSNIFAFIRSFVAAKESVQLPMCEAFKDVLLLLGACYGINKYWGSLYQCMPYTPLVPLEEFISSKLTAKANMLLQDPLVIMTGNIPSWLPQLAAACPFLLPFDTRQTLLYTTAFDRDRAMMRLRESQDDESGRPIDPNLDGAHLNPELPRKPITVNRDNLMKQTWTAFKEFKEWNYTLTVDFENEVGTGLGPTLEFYSLVSRELQRKDLGIWRNSDSKPSSSDDSEESPYAFSVSGLFPKPLRNKFKSEDMRQAKKTFLLLGKLMAKSLLDSRMIDIPLSPIFYRWLLGHEATLDASDLWLVDRTLAQSYFSLLDLDRQRKELMKDKSLSSEARQEAIDNLGIDDMYLEFMLPGYSIELKKGGKDYVVTSRNLGEYLRLVSHWTLFEGVQHQMQAFKKGFNQVVKLHHLSMFYSEELDQLFCGNSSNQPWDQRELEECCHPDHGYTPDSPAIRMLYGLMASYNSEERCSFVQFVTGSSRLPVGGFRRLSPPLTIVKKTFDTDEQADMFLPSVMTCVHYLKLPEYSSTEIMRAKLTQAMTEGNMAFHLS